MLGLGLGDRRRPRRRVGDGLPYARDRPRDGPGDWKGLGRYLDDALRPAYVHRRLRKGIGHAISTRSLLRQALAGETDFQTKTSRKIPLGLLK
jgi:hypothetical protein